MGLESLRDRRWCVALCLFENANHKCPVSLIPSRGSLYSTRNIHNIPLVKTKHKFFKNSFFPSTIIKWNNLDPHLRKSENFSVFRSNILKFIRLSQTLFRIVITLEEFVLLQNLNFNMASKMRYIRCVVVEKM